MSSERKRLQYVYIEAKADGIGNGHEVTLSGPTEIIQIISPVFKGAFIESLGTSMKISVSGFDSTFMKAAFTEEVLKHGFHLNTTIKDDFIVLSRAVELQ